MGYQPSYLWASAGVRIMDSRWPWTIRHLTPGTINYLADTAATHLEHRERFTLCLDKGSPRTKHDRTADFHQVAHEVTQALTDGMRHRYPQLQFSTRIHTPTSRAVYVQCVPTDEWQPPQDTPGPEWLYLQCDASWFSPDRARAGITNRRRPDVTVDLAPLAPQSSTHAEFFALCLAALTDVTGRTPLIIRTDSLTSLPDARLLAQGLMPSWVYWDTNDIGQRVVIAALTSMQMRTVTVQHARRRRIAAADKAADYRGRTTQPLHPRNWAKKQGIPLSWVDRDRGIIRPDE